MNRSHLRKILVGLAAVSLLTACTNDDGLTQGEPLPLGKYPLELNAGGLQAVATPATRGTVDGDWDDMNDQNIPLMDDSNSDNPEVKQYKLTIEEGSGNKTVRLTSDTPFYWESTTEQKAIEAWYSPKKDEAFRKYKTERPAEGDLWETATTQTAETMKEDDFLYVKDYMEFKDRKSMTLQFRHLLAKVTVNLMESESEYLTNAKDVSVALTNCLYEGNFDFDEERNMRIEEALMTDDNTANITLCKLNDPAGGAFATHEGLLIPQSVEQNEKLYVQVAVDGTIYRWRMQLSGNEIALKGGYEYTFNITVKEQSLDVSSYNYPTWEKDKTEHSGSIEI